MIVVTVSLVGCKPDAPAAKPLPEGHTEDDGHDHGEAGHSDDDGHDHADSGHDHGHEGPHGGHVIEFGTEKYHGELVHDDASGTVSIYLLDGKVKNAMPVDAAEVTLNLVIDGKPQQYKLPAAPLDGEPEGKSSRFELVDKDLLEALEGDATGRLNVTVDGEDLVGEIDHHEHEHEHHEDGDGHDHDEVDE